MVGPLARVQPLVLLQGALVGVGLAADVALVRLAARVRLQVALQVAELLEGPVAARALEAPLLVVDVHATLLHRRKDARHLAVGAGVEEHGVLVGRVLLVELARRPFQDAVPAASSSSIAGGGGGASV